MNEQTQLELSIEQAKANIELGRSIERLYKNKDFKKVVLEGYFKDEAIRLVMSKSNPQLLRDSPVMKAADIQADLDRMIFAIGSLQQYLFTCSMIAQQSEKAIQDDEQALEELRNESQD